MTEASNHRDTVLGIDIGSAILSIVQIDTNGRILNRFYRFHKGNITASFEEASQVFDFNRVRAAACTSNPVLLNKKLVKSYNSQVSIITSVRKYCSEAVSVLHIGAEKFMLIKLDSGGKYQYTRTNSSCAAGTGSFLDQQAARLNLSGIEELTERALKNKDEIPGIASRCSVFASTDLIHAQQRGFSVDAICDSLCKGLAENILNRVFTREAPAPPLLLTGGVSLNMAVRGHLGRQLNIEFLHHEDSALFGAIGAGLLLLKESSSERIINISSFRDILLKDEGQKNYFHKPLSLHLSSYPDFTGEESYRFKGIVSQHPTDIETDIYSRPAPAAVVPVYIGIDIGSTSTKAIIIDQEKRPVSGLYTYTSGKPLSAVKTILEAVEDLTLRLNCRFDIKGIGTTGSGRNFIGKIINADLIIDEITSHARAAFELNPRSDTIIEIGGQDAKFTLLHNGNVTFSQMNTVCAAGTGSFLQEQVKKLGLTLSDYHLRVENVMAPLASDRCSVFMERDISNLLNNGYTVDEILATALHSVTENYLKKVASEGSIGNYICFQGATAKNKALVAAFEQRLGKPIYVSKYCHLTGALGTALILHEQRREKSRFRGLSLYRQEIKTETETCELCTNRCLISLADVSGEKVAYGFMCGRDYKTTKFVSKNQTGFDLLNTWERIFPLEKSRKYAKNITIGIPANLHMFEELALWKRFFNNLSIPTVTSENYRDPLKTGKSLAGAEFCSPINSMFGHVVHLSGKADYIFLPVLLQTIGMEKELEGQFCYYTQFSPSLIYTLRDSGIQEKCISPLLSFSKGKYIVAQQLWQCLKPIVKTRLTYLTVLNAFSDALVFYSSRKILLDKVFRREFQTEKDISVALLGRPYVILSRSLNKGIPEIFNSLGIKTFYQDMIPSDYRDDEDINILLKKIPWYYVTRILETAKIIAATPNLYPVLITAFKCSPDSMVTEYFKRVFNSCKKPYLILQIDEHDSNLGYETRIEAAIRSFRNHASIQSAEHKVQLKSIIPQRSKSLEGKTLVFPSWDPIVSPLLIANLKRTGIDARLMRSSELIIKKSMAHNTGQCLPINIIAQEFIEFIEEQKLDPDKTMLWAIEGKWACNLSLYPEYLKSILENYGHGMEKAQVYSGQLSHLDISVTACYYTYFAYLLGGLIRMAACRIRPYEDNRGQTDNVIKTSIGIMEEAFLGNNTMEKAIIDVISLFESIKRVEGKRPLVAIFGDFYVCDNDLMNQNLIHSIEEAGGEVVTTPYTDYVKLTLDNINRRMYRRGEYFKTAQQIVISSCLKLLEDKYYRYFEKLLGPRIEINSSRLEKHLARFNINPYNCGESYDNILKIFYMTENYPGIALFVQANPAFCCPSLVTEAMTNQIRELTGVPVVTLTYDGTDDYKNDVIVPYLQSRIFA
jgi:predicted CoA-substrate-specific enzyme activase